MTTPQALAAELMARAPWLPASLAARWSVTYGARSWKLIEGCDCLADLGMPLGVGLYAREVDYLVQEEWARGSDDILWRRTKLGLFVDDTARQALDNYLTQAKAANNDPRAA